MKRSSRRVIVAGVAGGFALFGASSAWGYWVGSGTASGDTTLSTLQTITATGTVVGLYPDVTASFPLSLTVPHTGTLTITGVTGPVGSVAVTGAPGCTNPDVHIAFAGSAPLGVGVNSITLPGAATMGVNSQNACQGGTFTFHVNVTVVQ